MRRKTAKGLLGAGVILGTLGVLIDPASAADPVVAPPVIYIEVNDAADEILVGPDLAKIVTSDGVNAPLVTDGPFQEFKEWVAGYQIIDVESEERAIEIAGKLSAVPGPDGIATQQPIHVRQMMTDAPSDAAEMEAFLEQVGGES